MVTNLAKPKASFEQANQSLLRRYKELEGSCILTDLMRKMVFKEYIATPEFKKRRQGMARQVRILIQTKLRKRFPDLDLSFMETKFWFSPEVSSSLMVM